MKRLILFCMCCLVSLASIQAGEIHEAAKKGDLETIQTLIKQNPRLLNDLDERNSTPLHFACDKKHVDLVRWLVDQGADITVRDVDGDTPLYWAVYAGCHESVTLLLEQGASINDRNRNQSTPLHYAVLGNRERIVKLLIEHKADLDLKDYEGVTPLHSAVLRRQSKLARLLIHSGANLEAGDSRQRTPLMLVARETGDPYMAELLLDLGADIDTRDKYDASPLGLAAWRGYEELVDLLLDRKAVFDAKGEYGRTLLGYACARGLERLFVTLLDNGADLSMASDRGGSLLHAAANGGSAVIVKHLIQEGLSINASDRYGWSPLHYAAYGGREAVVDQLIQQGVDLNSRTLAGYTPFNLSDRWERKAVARRLLEAGAVEVPPQFPKLQGPYLGQKTPGTEPLLFAPDIVSSGDGVHGNISFSPDGKHAYWAPFFILDDAGYSEGAMLSSHWEESGWSLPALASAGDGLIIDGDVPFCTPDGRRIYFISCRPSTPGGRPTKENIWFVERQGTVWSNPRKVSQAVNALDVHWQISVSNKGTLYLGSGQLGICASPLENGKHVTPEPVKNPAGDDFSGGSPNIAPDESYLLFTSQRQEGFGGKDLYITCKDGEGNWTRPQNLGPTVNSAAHELCPMVSPDGNYLFFISNQNGRSNVYWVDAGILKELLLNVK